MSTNGDENFAVECKLEELYLEVTNACTHHCLHCAPRSGKPYPNELSLSKMQQLIAEAKTLGLRHLCLTGGEPFIRPEDTLQLIESTGKSVKKVILTNGTIFMESIAEKLAAFSSSTRLEMSIFSASSDIHDRHTGTRGSLVKMLRSTTRYMNRGINVRWGFILTGMNISEIDGVLQLASSIGITRVGISRIVPSGRARDNWADLAMKLDQFARFFSRLNEIKDAYSVNVAIGKTLSYEFVESNIQPYSCNAAISRMFIQADGSTLPCPAFKDLPSFLGKSVHANSLTDIWFSSEAFNGLRSYSPGPNTHCFSCIYASTCKGHCRAQQLHANGTLNRGRDPLCPITLHNAISNIAKKKNK